MITIVALEGTFPIYEKVFYRLEQRGMNYIFVRLVKLLKILCKIYLAYTPNKISKYYSKRVQCLQSNNGQAISFSATIC